MYNLVIFTVCFALALTSALPYPVIEAEDGQQFYLVPIENHQRTRRQTTVEVGSDGASASHTGKLFENDKHRIDGTAHASKPFPGPLNVGAKVDYTHKPSDSGLSIGAANTRGMGTDFSATGNYNIYRSPNGRATAGVAGEYSRHYGGPQGTGRPNYGVLGTFKYNF